jgi:hypothetical protein
MTAAGMTPEQAELHAQTPHPATADAQTQQAMQQAEATNMPPPEDPNAGPQFQRDKEKMQLEEKTAHSQHSREKEKMRLQDTMSSREHKRSLEALRHKDRSAANQAKLKKLSQTQKKPVGKPPAKKTAAKKTAKRLPPKKKGR